MRSVVFALFLSVFMLTGFSTSTPSLDFFSATAYAQEATPSAEAPAITVVEKDVQIQVASDVQDNKLEIPMWVGSIVMFIQSTPVVGPHIVKALSFAGIAAGILTLFATILMGLSGIMGILSKGKASPKWLLTAKKWLDYAVQIVKYLSMYNVQKPAPESNK